MDWTLNVLELQQKIDIHWKVQIRSDMNETLPSFKLEEENDHLSQQICQIPLLTNESRLSENLQRDTASFEPFKLDCFQRIF